ncbi:MAG: hypothetical protein N7Q72_01055, partial [Spiroplasma sp. Tabriz.8]|nr:hypothetical protein [Spiroplasma sp. Tabriz.8]
SLRNFVWYFNRFDVLTIDFISFLVPWKLIFTQPHHHLKHYIYIYIYIYIFKGGFWNEKLTLK